MSVGTWDSSLTTWDDPLVPWDQSFNLDCAVLADDVSVRIRNVTLHKTNPPFVLLEFNPWTREVRASAETERAWNHGSWSGAEWQDAVTIPLRVLAFVGDRRPGTRYWLALQQQLAAAFAASHVDIPLEWDVDDPDVLGGVRTYRVMGRPRLVDPLAATGLRGWATASCAFRALDPTVYSGGEFGLHSTILGMPLSSGGLTLPVEVPFVINATVAAGTALLTNAGTTPTGLFLRIDGPVIQPRVTLQTSGGVEELRYLDTLAVGQWLEVDTRQRTVMLNGTSSRRGLMSGDFFLLEPGTWEIAFNAAEYNPDAFLTVQWRDAWVA